MLVVVGYYNDIDIGYYIWWMVVYLLKLVMVFGWFVE